MTRKKHKKFVADDTDHAKHAASLNYGKKSGDLPSDARHELGDSAKRKG